MSKSNNFLAGCGVASIVGMLLFIFLPLAYIIRGFALRWLWLWFVSETFGITPINMAQAVGISIIAGFLTHQDCKQDEFKDDPYKAVVKLILAVVGPLAALGVGWLVYQFV